MTVDRVTVINLDRTPERLARFQALNPHLPIERFTAIDGRQLDRWQCVDDGLITTANPYKATALGCMASHLALWKRCASTGHPLHVAEDDAIFRHDFVAAASRALTALGDWDFVLWGWLFHWPMKARLGPGLGSIVCHANQDELVAEWRAARDDTAPPHLARLVSAAGLCAYSISPSGARRLLERLLPVAGAPAEYVAKPGIVWANEGLDVELTRHFGEVLALVSLPPLALTLHETEVSTISRG